jgi:hypothetical protein
MSKSAFTPMTGGCLCGAVRYEIAAEPIFSGRCYCTDCRRSSATGHSAVMAIAQPTLTVKGKLAAFTKTVDSGQPSTRKFCPTCGSGIYSAPAAMPGVVFVKASSLDDPERFPGGASIYASRAPSWDQPPAGSPSFPEMPPPNTDMN